MEVTITITASPATVRRILDILEAERGAITVVAEGAPSDEELEFFRTHLTELGARTIREIAERSRDSGKVFRNALAEMLNLEREELHGVMGGIGVRWAQISKAANPFLGRWDDEVQDHAFQIDSDLAIRLLRLFEEG